MEFSHLIQGKNIRGSKRENEQLFKDKIEEVSKNGVDFRLYFKEASSKLNIFCKSEGL